MKNNISLPTPCYVCEESLLEANLKILESIQNQTGIKILLALKAFAMHSTFDICKKYLKGCCASGLNEAILANEKFGLEVHTYSPAFKDNEFDKIAKISNHIIFNSHTQYDCFKSRILAHNSIGFRINPQYSSVKTDLYNPCAINSRLGITKNNFKAKYIDKIDGLHFHALCEQNVDVLEMVLHKFEEDFSIYFNNLKWINFGGGHHITRDDYDIKRLIILLKNFKLKYSHLEIYMEPGEAVAWQTGYLQSTVLDIVNNGMNILILDTSAEAHMPDTLAMPYKAKVRGASSNPKEKQYTYRLAGNTCLAGDIIGDYSFDNKIKVGDKIILEDMIHYTMVKTTTFNGINLPSIAIKRKDGTIDIVKEYGYDDYQIRLS